MGGSATQAQPLTKEKYVDGGAPPEPFASLL